MGVPGDRQAACTTRDTYHTSPLTRHDRRLHSRLSDTILRREKRKVETSETRREVHASDCFMLRCFCVHTVNRNREACRRKQAKDTPDTADRRRGQASGNTKAPHTTQRLPSLLLHRGRPSTPAVTRSIPPTSPPFRRSVAHATPALSSHCAPHPAQSQNTRPSKQSLTEHMVFTLHYFLTPLLTPHYPTTPTAFPLCTRIVSQPAAVPYPPLHKVHQWWKHRKAGERTGTAPPSPEICRARRALCRVAWQAREARLVPRTPVPWTRLHAAPQTQDSPSTWDT